MPDMGAIEWLTGHWLDLLQSIGIIGGFVFSAYSIRKESRSRQIANMLAAAQHHHAIWRECYNNPYLFRVVDKKAKLDKKPVTPAEQLFVTAIIIHLDSLHRAIKAKIFMQQEGLRRDVRSFFSLPIPKAVWREVKLLQDRDFVKFVEECLVG